MGVQREVWTAYINSAAWKEKRRQVLSRDKKKCVKCGSHRFLNVHHLSYLHLGNEPLEDLQTLCNACHRSTHGLKPIGVMRKRPKRQRLPKRERYAKLFMPWVKADRERAAKLGIRMTRER